MQNYREHLLILLDAMGLMLSELNSHGSNDAKKKWEEAKNTIAESYGFTIEKGDEDEEM